MKKLIISFIHIFLALCLLVSCKSDEKNPINNNNSTPSHKEDTSEYTSDNNELPPLPNFPFGDNPIELPTDEWE